MQGLCAFSLLQQALLGAEPDLNASAHGCNSVGLQVASSARFLAIDTLIIVTTTNATKQTAAKDDTLFIF
ncbi:hypothetical protein Q6301_26285, partial [Klebsiella quasipneumoniae]